MLKWKIRDGKKVKTVVYFIVYDKLCFSKLNVTQLRFIFALNSLSLPSLTIQGY